jgi:Zn-dependent protease with chaperone function
MGYRDLERGADSAAGFPATVFPGGDAVRQISATVLDTPERLVLEVDGAVLALDPAQVALSLAGHNDSRVAIEAHLAPGSWRGGEQIYAQVDGAAFLAHLAAHGPPPLRAAAESLQRKRRASSRRWRLLFAALVAVPAVGIGLTIRFSDALVARAVAGVPLSWEIAIGESAFLGATAGLPPAPARETAVVDAVFARLLPHVAQTGYPFAWKVVDVPQVNAFALPGGKVVVFSGLVREAARPEELAGVLAHEIEHAVLRHSLQKMVRGAGIRAVAGLLFGDLGGAAGAIGEAGVGLQELSYDRDQERAADLAAIELLDRAGIDPAGLPELFGRLAAAAGGGDTSTPAAGKALSLLSTHPASAERSRDLRRRIAELGPRSYQALVVP